MTREEAQALYVQTLLDKVRADPYPSRQHLTLIEASIPQAMIPEYLEVLMEKAAQDRFPSNGLLSRMRHAAQTCES
jgi:hypothetical protein